MKIEIIEIKGVNIAKVLSNEVLIKNAQDALDLMADINYQNSSKIIINESNLLPEFFDLKTGIAGEILQKFSNYRVQLAIVGDFSNITSKSLRDFIFESNKQRRINFVDNIDNAISCLTKA